MPSIKETAKTVNTRETVVVIGTGASKHLKTGKEYPAHPLTAENLLKSGHATYKDKDLQKKWEKENPKPKDEQAPQL